jgi:hypothetical protein
MKSLTDNGTLLALGLVGAVAAGSLVGRRGSLSRRPTLRELEALRARMDPVFEQWVCMRKGSGHACSSSGWCHYATHAVQSLYGGDVMQAGVRVSKSAGGVGGPFRWHLWNVLPDGTEIDLTGDQFGRPPVQISEPGRSLYSGMHEVKFKQRISFVPDSHDERLATFVHRIASQRA